MNARALLASGFAFLFSAAAARADVLLPGTVTIGLTVDSVGVAGNNITVSGKNTRADKPGQSVSVVFAPGEKCFKLAMLAKATHGALFVSGMPAPDFKNSKDQEGPFFHQSFAVNENFRCSVN